MLHVVDIQIIPVCVDLNHKKYINFLDKYLVASASREIKLEIKTLVHHAIHKIYYLISQMNKFVS